MQQQNQQNNQRTSFSQSNTYMCQPQPQQPNRFIASRMATGQRNHQHHYRMPNTPMSNYRSQKGHRKDEQDSKQQQNQQNNQQL